MMNWRNLIQVSLFLLINKDYRWMTTIHNHLPVNDVIRRNNQC